MQLGQALAWGLNSSLCVWRSAEVKNLRDLSPGRAGSVEAEWARRVRESGPVRSLDWRGPSVPIGGPTPVVSQPQGVLDVGPESHQVWSTTQFHSIGFSKSWISVKSVNFAITQSRLAICFWQCLGTSLRQCCPCIFELSIGLRQRGESCWRNGRNSVGSLICPSGQSMSLYLLII